MKTILCGRLNILELGREANEDQEEMIMKKGQTLWESGVTDGKGVKDFKQRIVSTSQ